MPDNENKKTSDAKSKAKSPVKKKSSPKKKRIASPKTKQKSTGVKGAKSEAKSPAKKKSSPKKKRIASPKTKQKSTGAKGAKSEAKATAQSDSKPANQKAAAPKRAKKLSKSDILIKQYLRLEEHDTRNAVRRGWTAGGQVEYVDRRIQMMKERTLDKLKSVQASQEKPMLSRVNSILGRNKSPHLNALLIRVIAERDMSKSQTTSYQDARKYLNNKLKVVRSKRVHAFIKAGKSVGLERQATSMMQSWSDAHVIRTDVEFEAEAAKKSGFRNRRLEARSASLKRMHRVATAARVSPLVTPLVAVGVAAYQLSKGKSLAESAYTGADVATANSLSEYNYLRERGYNKVASGSLAAANFVTMGLFGQSGYTAEQRAAKARMSKSANDLRRKNRRRQNSKQATPQDSESRQDQARKLSGNKKRGTQNRANLKAIIKSRRRNAKKRTQRGTR